MGWTVGDHGFEMSLSRRVPGLIANTSVRGSNRGSVTTGCHSRTCVSWAVHPGGPKIVSAVEESLGLSAEALAPSRGVFAEYGNMSSPTVLFILNAPRAKRRRGPAWRWASAPDWWRKPRSSCKTVAK